MNTSDMNTSGIEKAALAAGLTAAVFMIPVVRMLTGFGADFYMKTLYALSGVGIQTAQAVVMVCAWIYARNGQRIRALSGFVIFLLLFSLSIISTAGYIYQMIT